MQWNRLYGRSATSGERRDACGSISSIDANDLIRDSYCPDTFIPQKKVDRPSAKVIGLLL